MSLIRIPISTGKDTLVRRIHHVGVWAVTPYVVANEHSEHRFQVTHTPSGRCINPQGPLSRELALQLCRLLGEFFPDFAADAAPRSNPAMPPVMAARFNRWADRLRRTGSFT